MTELAEARVGPPNMPVSPLRAPVGSITAYFSHSHHKHHGGKRTFLSICKDLHFAINKNVTNRKPRHITLKGRDIPFVKDAKYLGVIFGRKITRRNDRHEVP